MGLAHTAGRDERRYFYYIFSRRRTSLSSAGAGMTLRKFLQELDPGSIATIAGAGWREGGAAAATGAGWPMGVVRERGGDLICNDYFGCRIWRIDRSGILHTFAGDGVPGFSGDGGPAREARFNGPHDLWQDVRGNLFLSDLGNHRIRRIDAQTGVITT